MPCNRSTMRDSVCQLAAGTALLLYSGAGFATDVPCISQAARRFALSAPLLQAIVQQESSGRCTRRHPRNANGTYDIGCAGINSAWIPALTKRFGIAEQDLLEPCTNVHVAAWILAHNLHRHGDTWRAVGAYNAATESKRIAYTWKIVAHMRRLPAS